MATYIVRRVIQGVIVLFLSTFMSYSIILLMPGGPAQQLAEAKQRGAKVAPDYIKKLEKQYGLDQPWPLSYFLWLFDPNDTVEYNY
jgi:peptide/nickel transport system permease protein